MRKSLQLAAISVVGLLLLAAIAGCGGGGGGSELPPPPPALVITTTTLPDGVVGQAYSQTINANGGTGARTFSITVGALPAGLNIDESTGVISGTPTGTITANFTVQVVDSGTPQQTDTQALTIDVNNDLVITTTCSPDATIGVAYSQTVFATGGTSPYTFTISSGTLPAGLNMNAAGAITGTPTAGAMSQNFTVRVADSSSPQNVDTQLLSITITNASLGRNDTIATATPLCNGTFNASISPLTDPASDTDPGNADRDVYSLAANGGNVVTIQITAFNPPVSSQLDSVIEIVNASNVRFTTCRVQAPATFTSVCMNDDIVLGVNLDSRLEFQVPGVGAQTFFVRVLDFRGDARPDLLYQITITGAN